MPENGPGWVQTCQLANFCPCGVPETVGMPGERFQVRTLSDTNVPVAVFLSRVTLTVCANRTMRFPAASSNGVSVARIHVAITGGFLRVWFSLSFLLARCHLRLPHRAAIDIEGSTRFGRREAERMGIAADEKRFQNLLSAGTDEDVSLVPSLGGLVLAILSAVAAGSVDPDGGSLIEIAGA